MSYDDGSVGHGEESPGYESDDGAVGAGFAASAGAALSGVVGRLRNHVREWPRRYVEQQVEAIDAE
jgi:hypothetical protein